MGAFEEAVRLGVDGIETDVRLSSDGLPVLFHDRVAANGAEVAHITADALSQIVRYEVPLLQSALDRWKGILWDIEIKTPSASDAVIQALANRKNASTFLVTSFWHPLLREIHEATNVSCGLLFANRPLNHQTTFDALTCEFGKGAAVVFDYEIVDHTLLTDAHSRGIKTFVYNAHTRGDHFLLRDMDVTGVITDHLDCIGYVRNQP